MDNLLSLSDCALLDAEQAKLDERGSVFHPRLLGKPNGDAISVQLHKCFTHVDEEVDAQCLRRPERVKVGRCGVGQQGHVRFVDLLEATDRRTVEVDSILEEFVAERARRNGEVLHDAGQVAEANVDELDALILDIGQQVVGSLEHLSSGEVGRALRTLCGYALEGTQMDNLLSVERLCVLDAEQAKLDERGSVFHPRFWEA